jgi:hypothetical protein
LGVSGPLSSLQNKLKNSLEVLTKKQSATRTQQHERLEDLSKTVQHELDAPGSAHLDDKSAFEAALLGMHSDATQASTHRGGKLARIAELDDEFDLLQQDRGVLVKRLNTVSAISVPRHCCELVFWARLKLPMQKSREPPRRSLLPLGATRHVLRTTPCKAKRWRCYGIIFWRASDLRPDKHKSRAGKSFYDSRTSTRLARWTLC